MSADWPLSPNRVAQALARRAKWMTASATKEKAFVRGGHQHTSIQTRATAAQLLLAIAVRKQWYRVGKQGNAVAALDAVSTTIMKALICVIVNRFASQNFDRGLEKIGSNRLQ
jgi:hypothetical protein